ncbi:MAG: hypothetical protein WC242_00470 [Candidatus Paceibacterota bacterium]
MQLLCEVARIVGDVNDINAFRQEVAEAQKGIEHGSIPECPGCRSNEQVGLVGRDHKTWYCFECRSGF